MCVNHTIEQRPSKARKTPRSDHRVSDKFGFLKSVDVLRVLCAGCPFCLPDSRSLSAAVQFHTICVYGVTTIEILSENKAYTAATRAPMRIAPTVPFRFGRGISVILVVSTCELDIVMQLELTWRQAEKP